MRNYPEFVTAFWATQLIGGVCTMMNAWSPKKAMMHCIKSTSPKVIIVDSERADKLVEAHIIHDLKADAGLQAVFVARPQVIIFGRKIIGPRANLGRFTCFNESRLDRRSQPARHALLRWPDLSAIADGGQCASSRTLQTNPCLARRARSVRWPGIASD